MPDVLRPLNGVGRALAPAMHTLRHYSVAKLRHDLAAGLTVSVVEIPQAMAYALIAGVSPEYGLYTSILQGILGAILSSSEHLTTGPTNTQSLLAAAAVQRLVGDPAQPIYLEMVFALTLLKGLIQFTFALARMGHLVRYIGRSVLLGVASGAGVLILIGQLPGFLGIRLEAGGLESPLPGMLNTLHRVVLHADQIDARSVLLGAMGVAIILGCRAISRFVPGALIAVAAGGAAVWAMGWSGEQVLLVGELPRGLPAFHLPDVSLAQAQTLLPMALAMAMLGLIESVAIAKTLGSRTGQRIDPNQEFLAQGAVNTLTGLLQCIPGSGSFTRSALDCDAGGKTRFAAVFNALFVLTIFLGLAPAASHIPLASLAAVLFVIAFGLIEWRYYLRVARTSRADAAVFVATFASTLLLSLEYAVFIGVFLNLALHLQRVSQLHMNQIVRTRDDRFLERPLHDRIGNQPVMFLQIEGDLFFGVADELADRLSRLARGPDLRVMIIRLKRTHSIDSTVLDVLEQFIQQMQQRGRHVILCGLKPQLLTMLQRAGLAGRIGRANLFETGLGVFTSAKLALTRARQLVGRSIDTTGFDSEEDSDQWAYEI